MKTPSEENHDLIRWLDDEMTTGERRAFEAALKTDPGLAADVESMRQLSERLKEHLPAEISVPHADFFNSQIQVCIAQIQAEKDRECAATAASTTSQFSWLRLSWLSGAAAAVWVIVGLVWTQSNSSGRSTIVSTYTPNPSVKAQVLENTDAGATVLLLEGLTPIPAEKKVVGFHVHHAESDAEVAMTTLFDENGAVLAVVALNAQGQPQMLK